MSNPLDPVKSTVSVPIIHTGELRWGLADLPIVLSDTRPLVLTRHRFGFLLQEEEHDPQYEPVIHLTDKVETKTLEEDEEQLFKMYATSPISPFPHTRDSCSSAG